MKSFIDFMSAALPWICMGLLVAVFAAKSGRKKSDKDETDSKQKENYGLEGMSFGMCFGVALGTALGNNTGIGMSLGMLLGLAIGSCIEKKETGKRG